MNEQDKLNHIFAQVEAWRKSAEEEGASAMLERDDTHWIGYWDGQVDAYTTVLSLLHRVKFPVPTRPDEEA